MLYSVQNLFPPATCSVNSIQGPKVWKSSREGMASHLENTCLLLLPLKLLISGEPPILISDYDNGKV